ncbi:aspartic-type endopeptidase [Purpureocillium lilacinum]|uniref:Aspartic-type endopeptidase n=1 Tax=Purpureocillium lilacinum TaxID=33203 RepID=A0A179HKI2_PURLI|nr:aspartic-type endopeptidase [Purpureocillium lilacinum]OAQ90787.1 aspartic-type endopeptidase [Purpureocillium lilacinum]
MKALVCLCLLLSSFQALAAPSSPGNGASVPWDISKPLNGITFERVKAVKPPTPDRPAPRFSRLHNIKGKPGSFTSVSALGRLLKTPPAHHQHVYQNVSATGDFSTQYAIQCGWDGVPLWLLFDTGSSDTWAVKTGFRCNDGVGGGNDQEVCGFGSPTIDEFSGGAIEDLHFLLKYGSGEQIVGPMGYSDLTCGGVHVARQQVGLANDTYWHGNNLTVGILGLAYPSLTSAFYGEVGSEATWNAISYTPFFTNAITQGTIDPVFSVAILKNSSEGMLAWGGLPPMDWRRGRSAETDLIIANLIGQAETAWRYSFYTIIPDGIKWGQSTDTTKFPYIVDTGTTMNYLPPPLAEQIAMAFQPRAVYLYQWGAYFAPCNAIPPQFAIIISGVEFWINPADLMYQDLKDPLTGYCAVAIASGGAGPYILGDVFLQNVVAVFDVGAAKMRFYSR